MKIFALETNQDKFKQQLLAQGEQVILHVHYHGFLFFFRFLKYLFYTLLFLGIGYGGYVLNAPIGILAGALGFGWFIIVFMPLLRAMIDWWYDTLILTDQELVLVNQTSFFRREVRQMNLENLAAITDRTQFWNIFGFGIIAIDLKEGVGESLALKYIPRSHEVAAKISETVVNFKRKREEMQRQPHPHPPAQ